MADLRTGKLATFGIAIGIGIGTAVGAATRNLEACLVWGGAIGLAIGFAMDKHAWGKKSSGQESTEALQGKGSTPKSISMVGERRSSPRQMVNSPIYVRLGPSAGGFLCDLSEGGLAIELFDRTVRAQAVQVGFDLPNTGYRIEAIGQISWTNESARRAGLEFVKIPRETRRRIGHWISLQKCSRRLPSRYLNGT